MKRKQKIGVLSALVALAMGSFGVSQMAQATDYTAGSTITIDTNNVINVKNMTQGTDGSLALGSQASASGMTALAVGAGAKATGSGAVALGGTSKAQANNATAVGVDNTASSANASAIGFHNTAEGLFSSAIGMENKATGYYDVAFGGSNKSTGSYGSMAIGLGNESSGTVSGAFGYGNVASGNGASAFGANNEAGALRAAAMGTSNTALGQDASAMGVSNTVYGSQSAAFGYNNTVGEVTINDEGETVIADDKGKNTYVFGGNNTVTANNALVLGANVTTVANNSVVIGEGSTSEEANTVSIGTTGNERKIVHVAAGTDNHDVATYGQLIKAVDGGYKVASTDANAAQSVELEYNDDKSNATKVKITVEGNGEVAPGDKRLVNGGTVYNAISAQTGDTSKLTQAGLGDNVVDSVLNVNDKVGSLSQDLNKVGAGAAALAALHPEGFDPADKWSFAVGYGHYKNANAGALGAFYKPNFDTTLSIGGTIGNGSSMMNAGVSFKLGQRGARLSQNASNSQLVQEVNALRAENAQQAQEIRELKAQMAKVLAKVGG